MKKIISFLVIAGMLMVGIKTPKAQQTCYDGVCFPKGDVSFADSVVSYVSGGNVAGDNGNPQAALGPPDDTSSVEGKIISLGCTAGENGGRGVLVVKFTDNSLTTSGDSDEDLWIFEVGGIVEPTDIAISTDGSYWIEVGSTSGATDGIDIDAKVGEGVELDV